MNEVHNLRLLTTEIIVKKMMMQYFYDKDVNI